MIRKLRVTVLGKTYDVTVETVGPEAASRILPGTRPVTTATTAGTPAPASKPAAPRPAAAAGDIASPLSGKIVAVSVERGRKVTQGDSLITIEAMKMNTYVTAQTAGTVTDIKVEVGQAVEEGQVLLTLV